MRPMIESTRCPFLQQHFWPVSKIWLGLFYLANVPVAQGLTGSFGLARLEGMDPKDVVQLVLQVRLRSSTCLRVPRT